MEFLVVLGILAVLGLIFEKMELNSNAAQDIPEDKLMTSEEWDEFERECLETWAVENPILKRKDPDTGKIYYMFRSIIVNPDGSKEEGWEEEETDEKYY